MRTLILVLVTTIAALPSFAQTDCPSIDCGSDFNVNFNNDGSVIFCEGESITLTNESDAGFDEFEIDWGDGTVITVDNYDPVSYEYNIPDSVKCDIGSLATFDVKFRGIRYCDEGTSCQNGSYSFGIQPKPLALFGVETLACVGQVLDFADASCHADSLFWDFGNGDTSQEENPNYAFPALGTYTVTLTAFNNCGFHTRSQIIEVIEEPVALALSSIGADPDYTLCTNVPITLDGATGSTGEITYEWDIPGSQGYTWILPDGSTDDTPNIPDPGVVFTQPGTYLIILEVNNGCDQPDLDTLVCPVVDAGVFGLQMEDDACASLSYTPEPFNPEVTYTINGTVVADFPIDLPPDDYVVTAENQQSDCATGILTDSFSVLAVVQAEILALPDTICSSEGTLTLNSNAPGQGSWRLDGTVFDGTLTLSELNGDHTISYGNEPCLQTASATLHVLNVNIEPPTETAFCFDDTPLTLTASPPGGTFSGPVGIDSDGTFDPALIGAGTHTLTYNFQHPQAVDCVAASSFEVEVTQVFADFVTDTCTGSTVCFDTLNVSVYDQLTYNFPNGSTSNETSACVDLAPGVPQTVTLTVTRNGCTAETDQTVELAPPAVAQFAIDHATPPCGPLSVDFVNQSEHGSSYLWDFGNGTTSTDANPAAVTYEAPNVDTTYLITLLVRNACTAATFTEEITVLAQPEALFGTNRDEYCSGDTLIMSNNSRGDTYLWTRDGAVISTDSIPPVVTHMTSEIDSIELCLAVTNECGTETFCKRVIFTPTDIVALFNVADTDACTGITVCFTNFSNSNEVQYDFGDGQFSNALNPCHTYAAPGTYPVSLKAFGCGFDEYADSISVHPNPVPILDVVAASCPEDSVNFAVVAGDVPINGVLWDFGDGDSSSISQPSHLYTLEDTTVQICATVFYAAGCQRSFCQPLELLRRPQIDFTQPDSVCVDEPVPFASSSPDDLATYLWDFGTGDFEDDPNPIYSFPDSGLFTVQLYVEDQQGCSRTVSRSIYVRSLPVPEFTFTTSSDCDPATVTFDNLSENADSYEWDFNDGSPPVSTTHPVHTFPGADTYTVRLTAVRAGVCMAVFEQDIIVAPTPVATMTAPLIICQNAPWNYQTDTLPGVTVSWDFGDGTVAYEPNGTHHFTAPGTFPILLIHTLGACSDTTEQEVEVYEAVDFTATTVALRCHNDTDGTIDLTAVAGTSPFAYAWSDGTTLPDRVNLSVGNYAVVVTDANGCTWDTLIALPSPPPLVASVESVTTVSCFGGMDGELTVEVSGGVPDYQYDWSNGSQDANIFDVAAGTHTLTLTDANDCVTVFPFEVPQNERIAPVLEATDFICYGSDAGQLDVTDITGGVPDFSVVLVGKDTVGRGTRFEELPPYPYRLDVTDALGCTESFEVPIREWDSTGVSLTLTMDTLRLGEMATLSALTNATNPELVWTTNDDRFDCDGCTETLVAPVYPVEYQVTMTDENGCVSTDVVNLFVRLLKNIWLPTAFTPDNSGRNDVYMIRNALPSLDRIELFQIYDQKGDLLFERTDVTPNLPADGWDGNFRARPQPPGKFTYVVQVAFADRVNHVETLTGKFLLIR